MVVYRSLTSEMEEPPKVFECIFCHKRFASEELLEAHMRQRHPQRWRLGIFERIVIYVREKGAATLDELAEMLPVSKSWLIRNLSTLDEYEDISYNERGIWTKGKPPDWAFW